jgi:hypothetical protein
VELAASKGVRGKAFILVPQKLAVGNKSVETGTSGLKIGTSKIGNIVVTGKTGYSSLVNRTVLFFLVQ